MNVYDFFTDSAKKAHEASIPDKDVSDLVDKVNNYGEKINRMNLEEDGALSVPKFSVTDKAEAKVLEVTDSLRLSGGRLYIASRHPEETNSTNSSAKLHKQQVVINPEEWDDVEKNIGTSEKPVNVTCYVSSFSTDGFNMDDIVDISRYETDNLDPNIVTYMANADFNTLFDQTRVILRPIDKDHPLERPAGRIAFSVRYVR